MDENCDKFSVIIVPADDLAQLPSTNKHNC